MVLRVTWSGVRPLYSLNNFLIRRNATSRCFSYLPVPDLRIGDQDELCVIFEVRAYTCTITSFAKSRLLPHTDDLADNHECVRAFVEDGYVALLRLVLAVISAVPSTEKAEGFDNHTQAFQPAPNSALAEPDHGAR